MMFHLVSFSFILLTYLSQEAAGEGCSLCYTGEDPPDLTFAPSILEGSTCGELVQQAAATNTSDPDAKTCTEWQVTGLLCGCPVREGGCPLCSDGSVPPDLESKPPELEGASCADMVTFAAISSEGNTLSCSDWTVVGLLCGCPLPDYGNSCPLCYDGSAPPDLNFNPPEFQDDEPVSCNQLRAAAGNPEPPEDQNLTCTEWLTTGLLCGCPVPDNTCTLCEDGTPIPNPDQQEGSDTCELLGTRAAFSTGDECDLWQATAGVYCGCENPLASQGFCRICGGDTLLPNTSAIAYTNEEGDEISCGQAEFNVDSKPCELLQEDYAEACGCPVSPTFSPETKTSPPTTSSSVSETKPPTAPSAVTHLATLCTVLSTIFVALLV